MRVQYDGYATPIIQPVIPGLYLLIVAIVLA